jgi:hypothetical protein
MHARHAQGHSRASAAAPACADQSLRRLEEIVSDQEERRSFALLR